MYHSRPAKENRLCSSISKGEVCAYGDTCQYNHDFKDFLSRKPADIGTDCYQFITFGHCLNGLMCRYGSNHINVETGENLIRTEGVIERPAAINLLSKDLQLLLRKKKYSEHIKAIYDSKTADTAHTAQKLELEINHATFVGHEPRTVKLVDFSNKVYVAPLTTVGNLPFRRILKDYGADITCGEMALGVNLEQGQVWTPHLL